MVISEPIGCRGESLSEQSNRSRGVVKVRWDIRFGLVGNQSYDHCEYDVWELFNQKIQSRPARD
jgi:hypothetical protein